MCFLCPKLRPLALMSAMVLSCSMALLSCKREERDVGATPSEVQVSSSIPLTDLVPGPSPATSPGTQPVVVSLKSFTDNYQNNAYALSQGQQLFEQYNCHTCHAHGGGDIGPPLIDDKWIYGSQPEQIFATIVQGRPNGMPAFGTRLNEQQVWQLTAYVRSMSGMASKNAAPAREDHMKTKPPENSMSTPNPKNSSSPPAGERPE
jgi:cytochrome c oxidase cbb3-type subunit 3